MKHTPGPWSFWPKSLEDPDLHEIDIVWSKWTMGFRPIATVKHDKRTSHSAFVANARLIACAPEMLEALRHANESSKCDADDPGRYADLIARATGQQQTTN